MSEAKFLYLQMNAHIGERKVSNEGEDFWLQK